MRFVALIAWLATLGSPVAAQTISAVLEPVQMAEMRATVSGRLESLSVREGQDVSAGEVIARMDSRVQNARVALAQLSADSTSEMARANALIAQAEGLVARVEQARARGAAQSWEVDQAKQALDVALADRAIIAEAQQRAKAQMNLEEAILTEFEIRAPFDGRILQIHREAGETISTQEVLVDIAALNVLSATAFVPVEHLARFEQGALVQATVETGNTTLDAEFSVEIIDPRIDAASRTFRMVLNLPNEAGKYLAGSTMLLTLE